MHLVDYTHPVKVPLLRLPLDRRSHLWYLRLDELPQNHPYNSYVWGLFRYPEWLEGGSAWVQAKAIAEDIKQFAEENGLAGEVRPVIGSDDPAFDEALAQALKTFDLRPFIAELFLKPGVKSASSQRE